MRRVVMDIDELCKGRFEHEEYGVYYAAGRMVYTLESIGEILDNDCIEQGQKLVEIRRMLERVTKVVQDGE